jgi:hypothetical protein
MVNVPPAAVQRPAWLGFGLIRELEGAFLSAVY